MDEPAKATREAARTLFLHVADTCDLPPLPAVATRAMSLARDPDAGAGDLARVVSSDAALAARVLKISRSVTYLRQQPPRSLQEAIMVVGFHALRKILIAASARGIYRADDVVATRLWEHALATALAADELAVAAGEGRGGDGFIAGLLHDVGKLVFHLSDPETFAISEDSDEVEVFGVTHATVGGCLAEKWGLERAVIDAIMLHHEPNAGDLAGRVALADRIAGRVGFPSSRGAPPAEGGEDAEPGATALIAERVTASFATERTLFG